MHLSCCLVGEQFLDDARGMTDARRFDNNPCGSHHIDELAKIAAEVCLAGAAEAAPRHQSNVVRTPCGSGHGQRIDAGIGEFIEQYHPVFFRGLARKQGGDRGRLAATERSGEHSYRDRLHRCGSTPSNVQSAEYSSGRLSRNTCQLARCRASASRSKLAVSTASASCGASASLAPLASAMNDEP